LNGRDLLSIGPQQRARPSRMRPAELRSIDNAEAFGPDEQSRAVRAGGGA